MSDEKSDMMPILGISVPGLSGIPMHLLRESVAMDNHGQSLATLKSRGGLGVGEALAIICGKRWGTFANDEASATELLKIVNADAVTAYRQRLRDGLKKIERAYISAGGIYVDRSKDSLFYEVKKLIDES